MQIHSNLSQFNNIIEINAQNGQPRKIITTILKNIKNEIVLIGLIFVGRRLITKENLKLLQGRRHRKYFGLKYKNKISIKFGWHKIKNLTNQELSFLQENWNFDFFENQGKHLIEKSGGSLSANHLIYTQTKQII